MKVKIQSSVVRLLIGSCLFASVAQAAAPAQGFYENSTSTPLIALLDSAQSTIDIEIYTMNDPIAQRAVLNALAAHVRVRIIQEPTPVGAPCKVFDPSTSADNASCTALKLFKAKVLAAGGMYVPFTKNLCGSGIYGCVEHGKMVLVDGKIAMLSTGNFDSTNLCDMSASRSSSPRTSFRARPRGRSVRSFGDSRPLRCRRSHDQPAFDGATHSIYSLCENEPRSSKSVSG
jgi:hypothetical protein